MRVLSHLVCRLPYLCRQCRPEFLPHEPNRPQRLRERACPARHGHQPLAAPDRRRVQRLAQRLRRVDGPHVLLPRVQRRLVVRGPRGTRHRDGRRVHRRRNPRHLGKDPIPRPRLAQRVRAREQILVDPFAHAWQPLPSRAHQALVVLLAAAAAAAVRDDALRAHAHALYAACGERTGHLAHALAGACGVRFEADTRHVVDGEGPRLLGCGGEGEVADAAVAVDAEVEVRRAGRDFERCRHGRRARGEHACARQRLDLASLGEQAHGDDGVDGQEQQRGSGEGGESLQERMAALGGTVVAPPGVLSHYAMGSTRRRRVSLRQVKTAARRHLVVCVCVCVLPMKYRYC
eukprot:Rhum_TRINITY_DN15307_c2_g2::Rhum_TRINITY_DN15307_c2_g2_i1::g.151871::m.151871